MHLSCPGCNTEYDVPEAVLAKGVKNFRCGVCGRQWPAEIGPSAPAEDHVDAALPAAESEPAKEPVVTEPLAPAGGTEHKEILEQLVIAARSNAAQEKTAAQSQSSKKAWLFSLLFLLIAAGYLLLGRATVMQAWPPSIRLYQALGLS